MKQKEQKNTCAVKQTRGFQKSTKKAKEDWMDAQCEEINLPEQKQQRESIPPGEGSNLRKTVDPETEE